MLQQFSALINLPLDCLICLTSIPVHWVKSWKSWSSSLLAPHSFHLQPKCFLKETFSTSRPQSRAPSSGLLCRSYFPMVENHLFLVAIIKSKLSINDDTSIWSDKCVRALSNDPESVSKKLVKAPICSEEKTTLSCYIKYRYIMLLFHFFNLLKTIIFQKNRVFQSQCCKMYLKTTLMSLESELANIWRNPSQNDLRQSGYDTTSTHNQFYCLWEHI